MGAQTAVGPVARSTSRRRLRVVGAALLLVAGLASPGSASVRAAASSQAPSASPGGSGVWQRVATSGPRPSERSTPAVAALGTSVYLFGGVKDDFRTQINTFYDDLYRLDTVTGTWHELEVEGQRPPARAFAASVAHPASDRMLVFGGASYGPMFVGFVAYDDLWAYDVGERRWSELIAENEGPSGRSRPNAWMVGDRLFVFGGVTATFETLDDLWSYDLTTNTWTELVPSGSDGSPQARHEALAGTIGYDGKLTIYGGELVDLLGGGFEMANDTWQYDLSTAAWTEVTPAEGNIDPPRNYGSAAVIDGFLYMHGGDTPGGTSGCGAPFAQNPSEELWRFDLVRHTWSQVHPHGDALVPLKRTNAATVGPRMYIFSGFDFRCEDETDEGQVWNLDVFAYDPTAGPPPAPPDAGPPDGRDLAPAPAPGGTLPATGPSGGPRGAVVALALGTAAVAVAAAGGRLRRLPPSA